MEKFIKGLIIGLIIDSALVGGYLGYIKYLTMCIQ